MQLALKIDVNTLRGALQGVPRLLETLRSHSAQASFFFSLGPDHSGRALKYAYRPERAAFLPSHDLKTLLYGTLLPAPEIGLSGIEILRQVRDEAYEVGLQGWDRVRWQTAVEQADPAWTERTMRLACARFEEIFATAPKAHAAAGWQMNAQALRLTQRLGFDYACDTRGTHPYMPVYRGEVIHCPQLPTTLPTIDELVRLDGLALDNVVEQLLELSRDPLPTGHVFTLRAELEGMKLLPLFEKLLAGWRAQGYELVTTRTLFENLKPAELPRHEIKRNLLPGFSRRQSRTLMLQDEIFLAEWQSAAA